MLRKFDENVKLLVERMNEQVKSRRMYYARELHAIEDAFIKERQELLDKYNREWTQKLDERRSKEVNIFLNENKSKNELFRNNSLSLVSNDTKHSKMNYDVYVSNKPKNSMQPRIN